jgi:hypothetical protein
MAYGKSQINRVHHHQYQMADFSLVVGVASRNEGYGDEVMRQHLPMVLSAILNVDYKQLLDPERPLCQHVNFHETI